MKNLKIRMVYLLSLLIFQELIFRLCFPIPEVNNFNRISYQVLDNDKYNDPGLFLENRTWQSSLDTNCIFVHSLNEYGFRDGPWKVEKGKGKKRIIFIGDSFMEGVMADDKNSIASHFQQIVGDEVEVYNAGMNGTGLSSYIKLIKDIVPLFQPDELKLVLYANDFTTEKTRLFELKLEPEFNSNYMPRLITLLKRLFEDKQIVLRGFRKENPFLYPVPEQNNPFSNEAHLLQNEVSKKVRRAMEDATFNYYVINMLYKETKALKKPLSIRNELALMYQICQENNTKLHVYYIPSRHQVSDKYIKYDQESCLQKCKDQQSLTGDEYQIHAKILQKDCDQLNISFQDLTPLIRKKEREESLYWNYDEHMRSSGYRFVSRQLKDF